MKLINVEKAFRHSDDGNTVNEYAIGEQTVSDRCAHVAVNSLKVAKWVESKEDQPAEQPAKKPRKTTK